MGRMTDETLQHRAHGLSGKALSLALFAKYAGLALYGVWAGIVEIPTFVIVGSSAFAVGWAITVSVAALLAAVGVARTWSTGHYRLELYSTAAFVLTFLGYSFALIYRSWTTGEWSSAPLALIPAIVCVLPTIQFYALIIRGKRRQNAEAAAS